MQGTVQTYKSINFINQSEGLKNRSNIPLKFLRAQNPSGLPPSKLQLKINTPILLLRNLFPNENLYNRTRLIIKTLRQHYIETNILDGQFHNTARIVPRITLTTDIYKETWTHRRKQFPIRLYFTITINKAQEQSLNTVDVDLRQPPFTHKQLYIALSRVTDVDKLDLLLPDRGDGRIENIIYPKILQTVI